MVSFVWGPGQMTPIHDHMVWGLIGMLRGAETETHFTTSASGTLVASHSATLRPGMVGMVSPSIGDIHVVANAIADAPSISIHVYGALADSPEVRLLVLRGEGKALCTGFDVGDIGSQTDATAIVAQDGFDASIGAEVARVERATALALARADTRDTDLADLVRSAAMPGLAARIAAYAGLRG